MTTLAPAALWLALVGTIPRGSSNMDCRVVLNLDDQSLEPILNTFDAWREALRSADLDAIDHLVVEDAEFWTHSQPALRGRAALRAGMATFLEDWVVDQAFDCDELIVTGELAVARGTEINRLTPRGEGDKLVRRQRAFSVLLRGAEGVWRFARGMTIPVAEED